jgi:UDPglucose 6-dehydrogenase
MRIAVAGLAFKPHTDDTREAPAVDIIAALLADGATVRGYDPAGSVVFDPDSFEQVPTLAEALRDAHAVVIATEWPEIAGADWSALVGLMQEPRLVFDGRNCVAGCVVRDAGGVYVGVGRR